MSKVVDISLVRRKLETYRIGDRVHLKSASTLGGSTGTVLSIVSRYVVLVKWPSGLRQREFVTELIKQEKENGLQE